VRGSGSVVEHLLAKEKVAGSNPVFRSKNRFTIAGHVGPAFCCLELPQLHLVFVTDRMALAICEHNPRSPRAVDCIWQVKHSILCLIIALLRAWRNGRRCGLKHLWGYPRAGSNPAARTLRPGSHGHV
jgi:hypothetical protein